MTRLTGTPTVAHSHVAFDVEGGRARKSECLHVGVDLGLVHATLRPRASEARNQLVVYRTAQVVDQLDAFVRTIMGDTVVDHDIEAICG